MRRLAAARIPHAVRPAGCGRCAAGCGRVVGQRIADAIADADRWNERYELLMLIDVFASKHPRAISCDHALAQLRAGVGPNPRDAWERAYSVGCVIDSGQPTVYVVSAGPDGKLGTPDDLVGVQAVEP
jgi:hypothetical protein